MVCCLSVVVRTFVVKLSLNPCYQSCSRQVTGELTAAKTVNIVDSGCLAACGPPGTELAMGVLADWRRGPLPCPSGARKSGESRCSMTELLVGALGCGRRHVTAGPATSPLA